MLVTRKFFSQWGAPPPPPPRNFQKCSTSYIRLIVQTSRGRDSRGMPSSTLFKGEHKYCFVQGWIQRRCNEVFWTGLKIDPGFIFQRWILNLGCFFSVENWDRESLKIYPGSFFNSFANTFFLIFDKPDMLNIDPVEYWPPTTEFWILIRWITHRVTSKYWGDVINNGGGGCHFALIEQFRGRKVNIFSIIIASYF